jgi:hypothetical protein
MDQLLLRSDLRVQTFLSEQFYPSLNDSVACILCMRIDSTLSLKNNQEISCKLQPLKEILVCWNSHGATIFVQIPNISGFVEEIYYFPKNIVASVALLRLGQVCQNQFLLKLIMP